MTTPDSNDGFHANCADEQRDPLKEKVSPHTNLSRRDFASLRRRSFARVNSFDSFFTMSQPNFNGQSPQGNPKQDNASAPSTPNSTRASGGLISPAPGTNTSSPTPFPASIQLPSFSRDLHIESIDPATRMFTVKLHHGRTITMSEAAFNTYAMPAPTIDLTLEGIGAPRSSIRPWRLPLLLRVRS